MRLLLSVAAFAMLAGCDTTPAMSLPDLSTAATADLSSAGTPMLTVNNTISWCTVTVTVGNQAAVMFSNASHVFSAASGTVVTLNAVPNATFMPVKWTGTTTMSGANATYTMSAAASQMVTACCATSAGTGC